MPKACKWKKQPRCKGPLTMFDDISIEMQFGKMQAILVGPLKWEKREKVSLHPTSWIDELTCEISARQQ
ncbi:hypothetical protein AMTR_s00267p00016920 [Amborella trichopoda]|uniref:Uncharacterized protein n=1 Tax=Amborella trichopoda TaxID=13333 RepID=W1NEL5_AMBTC|nr:hypothetical protein AMTR_s00267p00016920 [Amborella trichopoda]